MGYGSPFLVQMMHSDTYLQKRLANLISHLDRIGLKLLDSHSAKITSKGNLKITTQKNFQLQPQNSQGSKLVIHILSIYIHPVSFIHPVVFNYSSIIPFFLSFLEEDPLFHSNIRIIFWGNSFER